MTKNKNGKAKARRLALEAKMKKQEFYRRQQQIADQSVISVKPDLPAKRKFNKLLKFSSLHYQLTRREVVILKQLYASYTDSQSPSSLLPFSTFTDITPSTQLIKIPLLVRLTMGLGFNFIGLGCNLNINRLSKEMMETLRCIGLYLHHQLDATFPIHHDPTRENHSDPFRHILKTNQRHFRYDEELIPRVERYEKLFNLNHQVIVNIIKGEEFKWRQKQQQEKKERLTTQNCPVIYPNLYKFLLKNFARFCERYNVLFIRGDKGAGIIMCTVDQYLAEINRHLMDRTIYSLSSKVEYDQTMVRIREMAQKFDQHSENSLPIKLNELLPPVEKCTPSSFRIMWKLHKSKLVETKNYPGRPICSTARATTRGIAKILNIYLAEIVSKCPGILMDSLHLLNLLAINLPFDFDPINKKYFIVKADIKNMYTVLDHGDVKKAVEYYYKLYNNGQFYFSLPLPLILDLVDIVLMDNYIIFRSGDRYYRQVVGLAMGHSSSQYLANLTVSYLLKDKLNMVPFDGIRSNPQLKIIFQVWLLDDLLLILEDSMNKQSDKISKQCPRSVIIYSAKDIDLMPPPSLCLIPPVEFFLISLLSTEYLTFTVDYHPYIMPFLDLMIRFNHDDLFDCQRTGDQYTTRIFRKPESVNWPLHYSSNHPPQMFKSLVYSQGVRIIRNCSLLRDVKEEMVIMFQEFMDRGYPPTILKSVHLDLVKLNRKDMLVPKSIMMKQMIFNQVGPWKFCQLFGLDHFPHNFIKYTIPRPLNYPPHTVFNVMTYHGQLKNLSYKFQSEIKRQGDLIAGPANQLVYRMNIISSFRVNLNLGLVVKKINEDTLNQYIHYH